MKLRTLINLILVATLAYGSSACGTRGKLKSPSQIVAAEAKKANKNKDAVEQSESQSPAESEQDATPAQPPKDK